MKINLLKFAGLFLTIAFFTFPQFASAQLANSLRVNGQTSIIATFDTYLDFSGEQTVDPMTCDMNLLDETLTYIGPYKGPGGAGAQLPDFPTQDGTFRNSSYGSYPEGGYYFKVTCVNGNNGFSYQTVYVDFQTPPPPPRAKLIVNVDSSCPSASWYTTPAGNARAGVGPGSYGDIVSPNTYSLTLYSPPSNYNYLPVTNSDGGGSSMSIADGQTKSFTVQCQQIQPSCNISSAPLDQTVNSGSSATVSWSTNGGCTNASITPSGSEVPVNGPASIGPLSSSGTYTLKAWNANTGTENSKTFTITVNPPPATCTFTQALSSALNPVTYGESIDLTWMTANCTSVNISGGVYGGGANTYTTEPTPNPRLLTNAGTQTANTQYCINASGGGVSAQSCTTSTVKPTSPTGLSATPGVCSSKQINLSWNTSPTATNYKVYRDGTMVYNAGGLAFSDSDTTLTPGATYTYSFVAENVYGSSATVTKNATVPTTCPPPTPGCSLSPLSATPNPVDFNASYPTFAWTSQSCTTANISGGEYGSGAPTYATDGYHELFQPSRKLKTTTTFCINATGGGASPSSCVDVVVTPKNGCSAPQTETRTRACDPGYTGSITESRTKNAGNQCVFGNWVTTSNTCTLAVSQPATLNVYSNIGSSWSIYPANINDSVPNGGSGEERSYTLYPASGGTTYTLTPGNVSGYQYPPSVTNTSNGSGGSLTLFPGGFHRFSLAYAPTSAPFNYTLSNSGNVTIAKGNGTQYGQNTVTKNITAGNAQSVDLSLAGVPAGVSVVVSNNPCPPNCQSTITFAVPASGNSNVTSASYSQENIGPQIYSPFGVFPSGGYNYYNGLNDGGPYINNSSNSIVFRVTMGSNITGGDMSLLAVNTADSVNRTLTTYYSTDGTTFTQSGQCTFGAGTCTSTVSLPNLGVNTVYLKGVITGSPASNNIGYYNYDYNIITGSADVAPGTYAITVTGSPLGKTTNFNLIITPSNSIVVSCVGYPNPAKVGDLVTWTGSVSGAVGAVTYSWAGNNIPTSPVPTTNPYSLKYSTLGQKNATLTVRDSVGNSASCTLGRVRINFDPKFSEF